MKGALVCALAADAPSILCAASTTESAWASVELAHEEIWRRFVDRHDVLLDFTDLDGSVSLPTPEECRAGKPNALGWWTPIENGAMFNGLYLDGAVNRALQTQAQEDEAKASRLVEGLLRLADCSDVKGFVGRGFAADGQTTWPMGSNDQTGPWFYGLWRYLESGLAEEALRRRIVAKFTEVADALVRTGWRMPAEPPFNFRGSFKGITWASAPRLLFVSKAMHQLTGDAAWEQRYRDALHERPRPGGASRLETCERGMVFEKRGEAKSIRATWTGSCSAVALRGLWEMERDESVRAAFATGLRATAALAAEGLGYRQQFANDDDARYESDWRKLNELWKPQQTEDAAAEIARLQLNALHKTSPRRTAELRHAREAAFAAWVVTLCPEREAVKRHEPDVLATLAHFRAAKLRFVSFFPLESAWWRLRSARA
ncbi:MAG: hypothetical protein HYV60_13185 [Planctomycetia bacterium]|nr:hypothetical protein [Planctomycetia bacterium]